MLEFFAREPGGLPLADGAHLTPVPIDAEVVSLSAILLDPDYYGFIHAHTRKQPRIFKLLAFAQHDMTYQRVLALEQCCPGDTAFQLLLQNLPRFFRQIGQRTVGLPLPVLQSQVLPDSGEQTSGARLTG